MKKKAVAVTVVAALLGILAAALGFAAEAKRVKEGDLNIDRATNTCIYPRSPVGLLALAAAALLLVAQIIIHGFAGCVCYFNNRGSSNRRAVAWIVFIFAWITYVLGMLLLLRVGALYRYGTRISSGSGVFSWYCYVLRPGVAASGGALALISVLLGIVYYHIAERMKKETEIQAQQQFRTEIPMAQPQLPAQPPVFVHEDTYNRRQMP